MPPDIQHAQPIDDAVSTQDLEGHDQRVLHQVGVDSGVEDLDCAVVRGRGEEGECGVEGD
jgi:hypothetical protein